MKTVTRVLLVVMLAALAILPSGCSYPTSGPEGQCIVEAGQVKDLLGKGNAVLVDAQNSDVYSKEHIKGAVNISRADITISVPVENMLAPKENIEEVLGKNGISNSTTVIVYDDNNNMDAARLWWSLLVYGDENVKVVSGGLKALKAAKFETAAEVPNVTPVKYTAKDKNMNLIATIDEVKAQVDDPQKDVILLDTRTQEEFDAGTIPGSILLDYVNNDYKDGTYKSIQDIKIQYIEKGMTPDKNIIMYCKTSIRGAQTLLALYNAGYRNLKLYDGAWLEWSANNPTAVQQKDNTQKPVESNNQDNS